MLDQSSNRLAAISTALLPVPTAPILRQINGFGSALYGQVAEPGLQPAYFARLYLTALWLPVFPLGIYLVSHPRASNGALLTSTYRFHGRMPSADFHRLFGHRLLGFYFGALLQAIVMLIGAVLAIWLVHMAFNYLFGPSRHHY